MHTQHLRAENVFQLLKKDGKYIELLLGDEGQSSKGTLLLLHPHPHLAGTMYNKVVTTSTRVALAFGFKTIRFQFSAVTEKVSPQELDSKSLQDLQEVIAWADERSLPKPFYFLGFSYGAQIVFSHQLKKSNQDPSILIAPPLMEMPEFKEKNTTEMAVILAKYDELIDYATAKSRVSFLPKERLVVIDASHFFHGKLVELAQHLQDIFVQFFNTGDQ